MYIEHVVCAFEYVYIYVYVVPTEKSQVRNQVRSQVRPRAKISLEFLFQIIGREQERPISARCIRTSYLGTARKNVLSRALRVWILSRDGTFLRTEPRWDVLMR